MCQDYHGNGPHALGRPPIAREAADRSRVRADGGDIPTATDAFPAAMHNRSVTPKLIHRREATEAGGGHA